MLSVQHHGHKVTLERTNDGVRVQMYLHDRFVGQMMVEKAFHVVADQAYNFVRKRDWATPADLVHLGRK